ncbi:hypothetical protein [Streptomyces sp. SYSU K21746]
MPRALRRFPALLLPLALTFALTACGTEPSAGPSGGPPAGPSAGASAGPSGRPSVDRAELEARARAMQSAPELIYVTEVPGYALAKQSVGVSGHDGFQSTYVSRSGGMITLTVDRGTPAAAGCPQCERDGELWYRSSSGTHEYARAVAGAEARHVVRLSADGARVDRATLRRAAEAAHVADDEELDAVLPEGTGTDTGGQPVERGDLPPEGDGAPDNEVGASG